MLSTARSLAAAHPQAMVPCPACAASVRAENLDSHLGKTHPAALTSSYADDMPDNWDEETVRVGTYLRLANGRKALTVGCPHHTGLRKHWAGWQQGKQRRQWDITVDPPAFVSFQYAMATYGALTPRS